MLVIAYAGLGQERQMGGGGEQEEEVLCKAKAVNEEHVPSSSYDTHVSSSSYDTHVCKAKAVNEVHTSVHR